MALSPPLSCRNLLVPLLFWVGGCSDTSVAEDSSPPPELREWDSEAGVFHLFLTPDPDPPHVGEGMLELVPTLANSNPDFDGAIVLNANVELLAIRSETRFEAVLEEESSGIYHALLQWPEAGYWVLEFSLSVGDTTDTAHVGLTVDP